MSQRRSGWYRRWRRVEEDAASSSDRPRMSLREKAPGCWDLSWWPETLQDFSIFCNHPTLTPANRPKIMQAGDPEDYKKPTCTRTGGVHFPSWGSLHPPVSPQEMNKTPEDTAHCWIQDKKPHHAQTRVIRMVQSLSFHSFLYFCSSAFLFVSNIVR